MPWHLPCVVVSPCRGGALSCVALQQPKRKRQQWRGAPAPRALAIQPRHPCAPKPPNPRHTWGAMENTMVDSTFWIAAVPRSTTLVTSPVFLLRWNCLVGGPGAGARLLVRGCLF